MGTLERAINKIQRSAQKQSAAVEPGRPPVAAPLAAPPGGVVARRKLAVTRGRLVANGLMAPKEHEVAIAEQYRGIKRPLIANALGTHAAEVRFRNVIAVMSALPGEGKTFSSFNLAVSIAQEEDRPIVLVDADVVKPHLTEALGAQAEPGLLDLLTNKTLALADVLMVTDLDGLLFLPCGRSESNAHDLLASRRMETIVSELAGSDGAIVVFDSPPLLLTNEARVLAALAGQILLVVAASRTPQAKVLEAAGLIDERKAVNLVLNGASGEHNDYRYGSVHGGK